MSNVARGSGLIGALAVLLAGSAPVVAAQEIPTPRSHFGFEIGADGELADWDQLTAYYERLATTSPRIALDTLGASTQGRPFVMLTVTSATNHARLEELRAMQRQLEDPRRIRDPQELERLLDEGRVVVLITNHIHSSEVGSGQMPARLLHRLAASDEPRIRQILDNVVLLYVPSLNPDGTQMVADWWARWRGTEHEGAPLPWLYHEYIGHNNNRDWYAFTQVETQLAVLGAHNAWRPQIVHDIHQMGGTGARFFVPPYIDPIEPNVDPLLVTALNQLGAYMAAEMTAEGKTGVVINAIFDLYTPARAYQHYHGGVRILSETASARWAAPTEVDPGELGPGRGYHAGERSWNFPEPWPGGTWRISDIVDYMESGAMALLTNAAANRRFWLENFHRIQERAANRWESWPRAWIVPADQPNEVGLGAVLRILRMGDVEVYTARAPFTAEGRSYPAGTYVIPMDQPFASFAQTMLVVQDYPDLRLYPGGPPLRPYDVTAHVLPLLMGIEAVAADDLGTVLLSDSPIPVPDPEIRYRAPAALTGADAPRIGIFRSWQEPMPQGWNRWLLDRHGIAYAEVGNDDVLAGDLRNRYDVLVFTDQAPASIRDGWSADVMPEPYAGGLGDEGAAALAAFVREGGRVVAIERSADYFVELFDLEIRNVVADLEDEDFFIPGSILSLEPAAGRMLAGHAGAEGIAWFWRTSRAWESDDARAAITARYGAEDPVLAGWALGPERVAGRGAIVEASVGEGSVVLFGFQPNYRGQSIATWPLFFDALANGPRVAD